MQRDPIGYWDSMNLQQYVFNNPVNWVDPSGLDAVVFREENGIHFGVAVDTTKGIYTIDLVPAPALVIIRRAEIRITHMKSFPGQRQGDPVKLTLEQGDQFVSWAEENLKDYEGLYVIGGPDCRDLVCLLYEKAQELNQNQESQTCPEMQISMP